MNQNQIQLFQNIKLSLFSLQMFCLGVSLMADNNREKIIDEMLKKTQEAIDCLDLLFDEINGEKK